MKRILLIIIILTLSGCGEVYRPKLYKDFVSADYESYITSINSVCYFANGIINNSCINTSNETTTLEKKVSCNYNVFGELVNNQDSECIKDLGLSEEEIQKNKAIYDEILNAVNENIKIYNQKVDEYNTAHGFF